MTRSAGQHNPAWRRDFPSEPHTLLLTKKPRRGKDPAGLKDAASAARIVTGQPAKARLLPFPFLHP